MNINKSAWHYKVYQCWVRNTGGNKGGHRENLCHYVRVLLFWAPLAWLGKRSPTTWLKRAWVGFLALHVLGVGGWVGFLLVYYAITNPILAAIAVGCIVGGVAITLLLIFLVVLLITECELEVPGTIKLAAGYIAARKRRVCPFITFEG